MSVDALGHWAVGHPPDLIAVFPLQASSTAIAKGMLAFGGRLPMAARGFVGTEGRGSFNKLAALVAFTRSTTTGAATAPQRLFHLSASSQAIANGTLAFGGLLSVAARGSVAGFGKGAFSQLAALVAFTQSTATGAANPSSKLAFRAISPETSRGGLTATCTVGFAGFGRAVSEGRALPPHGPLAMIARGTTMVAGIQPFAGFLKTLSARGIAAASSSSLIAIALDIRNLTAMSIAAVSSYTKATNRVPIRASGATRNSGELRFAGTLVLPHLRGLSITSGRNAPKFVVDLIALAKSTARANIKFSGTANMAAVGKTAARGKASVSALLSLVARGLTAAYGGARDKISLMARSIAFAMGRLRISGRGSLHASGATHATDHVTMSPFASLKAHGPGAGHGLSRLTGKAHLSGASTSAAHGRNTPSGLLKIVARGVAVVFGRLSAPPRAFLLWARSIASFFGRGGLFRPRKPVVAPSRGTANASTTLERTVVTSARNNTAQDSLGRTVVAPARNNTAKDS